MHAHDSGTAKPAKISVAIVESDPLRLVGYQSILHESGQFLPVCGNPAEMLRSPDLELWLTGNVKDAPALEQIALWKRLRPEIKLLLVGPGNEDVDVLHALSAGAKGYLHEAAGAQELLLALSVVQQGSVWAPRRVLSQLIETVLQKPATGRQAAHVAITAREREVLELLVEGRTNREIAAKLLIEERTVKAHVAKLLQKVGAPNRIALTMHAIHNALVAKQP